MGEGRLQLAAALLEECELLSREGIEIIAVGTHEMTEHRTRNHCILMFQTVDQLVHVIHGVKAQTVHARVKFDVDRPAGDTLLTGGLDQRIQQTEGIDLRLQVVVEHGLEGGHLRVHDHDVGRDASLTQGDTLVGHSHRQIIDTMVLQRTGNLHRTSAITVGFDHAHHLRLGFQERAVVIQILHHGIEVHLKNGLVNLLLQLFRNLVEPERTGTLQQDQFMMQSCKGIAGKEMIHVGKELLVGNLDSVSLCREFRTDANKLVDTTLHRQVAHLSIEFIGGRTGLEDITEDQRLRQTACRLTTLHEIEGNIKRVDITIVRVVDEQTTALSFLDLQTHGNRFEFGHAVGQLAGCQSDAQCYGRTGDCIFDRSLVDERNRIGILLTLPDIGDTGRLSFVLNAFHEKGHLLVTLRPRNLLSLILHTTDATADDIVV